MFFLLDDMFPCSSGKLQRAYNTRLTGAVEDLCALYRTAREQDPSTPVFIHGDLPISRARATTRLTSTPPALTHFAHFILGSLNQQGLSR